MLKLIKSNQKNFLAKLDIILQKRKTKDPKIDLKVKSIIQDIRKNKDLALIKYEKKYSNIKNISLKNIKFSISEKRKIIKKLDKKTKISIDLAFDRILNFHKRQKLSPYSFTDKFKNSFSYKLSAIDKIGVYVPGGLASYPSSVLMNCIPAIVAGVKEIYMTTPSMSKSYNPAIIYAAQKCRVKEIYKIGGAQAIAAMAYGTKTIQKVDKIVGPGNIFVATAKKQVFGEVGIDMIAGPSEVTIVADKWSKPDWIAADLIAQAEHDESSQSIVLADDIKIIKQINYFLREYGFNNVALGVLSYWFDKPFELPSFSDKPVELSSEQLKAFEGTFANSNLGMKIKLWVQDGALMAQAEGQSGFPLAAFENDTFKFSAAGIVIKFHENRDKFTLLQGGGEFIFEKQ